MGKKGKQCITSLAQTGSDATKAVTLEKAFTALRLFKENPSATKQEIGEAMGVPAHNASDYVGRYLKYAIKAGEEQIAELLPEYRAAHLMEVERGIQTAWEKMVDQDGELRPAAVTLLTRMLDRQAKVLGLDAPTKIDMGKTGDTADIIRQRLSEAREAGRLKEAEVTKAS